MTAEGPISILKYTLDWSLPLPPYAKLYRDRDEDKPTSKTENRTRNRARNKTTNKGRKRGEDKEMPRRTQ